jgi:hypothetical protein
MLKRIAIHQPDFVPYLGFFHRFLEADCYVALDHVQFVQSGGWTHRDKIKTRQGAKWLTISVRKAPFGTAINQIELSTNIDWRTENLRMLADSYRQAPYFNEIYPGIENLYRQDCSRLSEFTLQFIEWMMDAFDVRIPHVLSSSLDPQGRKNEMLVDILGKLGATDYVSGVGARDYFDPAPFEQADIRVSWQNFTHPVYPQLHGEFIPYLSSLDLLFNCGIEQSRAILRSIR